MNKNTNNFSQSQSSADDASSDNKLLYFQFGDDMVTPEIDAFPSRAPSSKLLEVVHFYNKLNVIFETDKLQESVIPSTGKQHEKIADPLQSLINLIIQTVKPEKIYQVNYPVLTNGDITQYTDLIVIIPDSCPRRFSKIEPLLEMATLQHQEVFCTLLKSEKLDQILKRGNFYFSIACTEKNLKYSCCEPAEIPTVDSERISRLKAQAKLHFHSHLARAEKFLRAAKSVSDDATDGVALFMLHQATEITLRGIVLAFSGIDKRTHELRVLLKHAHRFCPELSKAFPTTTDEDNFLLQSFDEAYLKSRYQSDYTPERHLEATFLPKVEQVQRTARESFENTLDHL